jgi:hypothetical protein
MESVGDRNAQQELFHLIVARVWVRDERVAAISLRPNYHITMRLESEKPTQIEIGSTLDTIGLDISTQMGATGFVPICVQSLYAILSKIMLAHILQENPEVS